MAFQDTAELAARANAAGSSSMAPGAPTLAADSHSEAVARWLQWCDPNGSHTWDLAIAEGCDPYDTEGAWDALAAMLDDAA